MTELERVINNFPTQLRDGWELPDGLKIEGKFNKIIICGMGGSALPGRLLSIILSDLYLKKNIKAPLPVIVSTDYDLPAEADQQALILCMSYSGNTEETLEAYKKARGKELNIICVSAGGKLKELALKNTTPHIEIPLGVQPRMALGYFMGALLRLLSNSKIYDFEKALAETAEDLEINLANLKKSAQKISQQLENKVPIIYASKFFAPLAMIWKINFNENVKIPAFYNELPEMNHNEMNGFVKKLADFAVIIIQDENDHPRVAKRMSALAEVLADQNINVEIINLVPKTLLLNKIFASIIQSLFVTLFLAEKYGLDPIPVELVEKFKKLIA